MHHLLKKELAQALLPVLQQAGAETSTQEIYQALSIPPQKEMGHLALGTFPWARKLKRAPALIAQTLQQQWALPPLLSRAEAQGPYLNMTLKPEALGAWPMQAIFSGDFFRQQFCPQPERTMLEYSQPNTHKEIHVGHMLNLCLGKSLGLILSYGGHQVVSATYPGDVGTHVAKCLWYLKEKQSEDPPADPAARGAWLGQMYGRGHQLLEEQRGTAQEEVNRRQLTAILKEIHDGSGPYYELWRETREWSLQLMKTLYQWSDTHFDYWFFESEMDAPSLRYAQELYQQGVFIKDQGAIGIDLSDAQLGFCLMVKSDGNGLYATKDIELARRKFEQFHIEKSIYIVDSRQSHHFKQVFKTLERIGFPQAQRCVHLAYEFVELPSGPMSSRQGNIVPILDVIQEMEAKIISDYLAKYRGEWSEEEIQLTAHQVAQGAIFWGMLKTDPQKKIIFDKERWMKLEGDSGPYAQYVYARIHSLLAKFSPAEWRPELAAELATPFELELMVHLGHFNEAVHKAFDEYRPSLISAYLFDLCRLFNRFYAECPVGKAQGELQAARLGLCQATARVLAQGLHLLGIPTPQRM